MRALLEYSHNTALVAASFAIALMAGFSGLSLTRGASSMGVAERKLIVVIASIVLGGGIWSMHFVAMLGVQLPIPFYYDALITLVSALVAILLVGLALLILHFWPRTRARMVTAGALIGAGIIGMHYIGMSGMELCRPVFDAFGVLIAAIAAIGLSILAIWIAYGSRTKGNILLGTFFFGASVWAVHFIAMAGTGFEAISDNALAGPALSNEILAMGVALASFVICGTFLLTGVSFVEKPVPNDVPVPSKPEASEDSPQGDLRPVPFEQEGRTRFIERHEIAAVRAEGHYTILYAASGKLFCPWSISEAEARLAPSNFVRTHRSYLVNPAFVSEFKRSKDTATCYFEDVGTLSKVPVSRSRLPDVKSALGV